MGLSRDGGKGYKSMVMMFVDEAAGGVAQRLRQLLAQLQPGAEQANLHIRLAQLQRGGSFGHRQSLHIPQHEDQTVFFIELHQRVVEQLPGFMAVDKLFRRLSPVRDVFGMRNGSVILLWFGGGLERNGV